MSVTTVASLLNRADTLAQQLSGAAHEVTNVQWEQFDNAVYRTLHELIGSGRADAAYSHRSSNPLLEALRAYPVPTRLPPGRTYSIDYAEEFMDLSRRQVRDRIRQHNLTPSRRATSTSCRGTAFKQTTVTSAWPMSRMPTPSHSSP